ncbi:MAG TPA: hypothetical protein VEY67_11795 [Candidatus Dormibacteraeota bacterium]|nr:hypothetical protein [Candidatus Dormibacteraeota bacterium]
MSTSATVDQTAGLVLSPTVATGNAVNVADYLRVRLTNGHLSLVTRTASGTPVTLWSGSEVIGSGLRAFELRIDPTNVTLLEGPIGSLAVRVGPIAHHLTWTSANVYLHAHNDTSASNFVVDYDSVAIARR